MLLSEVICLTIIWHFVSTTHTKYTNKWSAEIHGGERVAQMVARDMGYKYGGQISPFADCYLLTRPDYPSVSLLDSSHLTRSLENLEKVKWAEQHTITERSRRGFLPDDKKISVRGWNDKYSQPNPVPVKSTGFSYYGSNEYSPLLGTYGQIANDVTGNSKSTIGKGNFDSIPKNAFSTKPSDDSQLNKYKGVTTHVKCISKKTSFYEDVFDDPMWHEQWYVQDYRTKDMPVMDHNVVPVYKMGYTGKGVTIMIPDDGIIHNHKDLAGNFDVDLSYDYCADKPGCEPDVSMSGQSLSEGTLCAGIIAMVANNKRCGVGIAYNAKVAGSKVICYSSKEDPGLEAKGLVHELQNVDIYSNSWGQLDDGKTMDKLHRLLTIAIDTGITKGRGGKGAIYISSAGNGNHMGDNCGADGLANNINMIVIASANQFGKATFYSERCTAVFATAYSGEGNNEAVVSTLMSGGCYNRGSGTASSVPIAAGIIALALEANSDLTYRDVMHLIAWSSEVAPLADNGEDSWYKNGHGLWVSNDFGFGLLNAENMVNLAKNWVNVPEKHTCTEIIDSVPTEFDPSEGFLIVHETNACQDDENAVNYLEEIELTSTIGYAYRGAIFIYIKSPEGTKTTLLEPRPLDNNNKGLLSWSIKSVHNWGEAPKGKWTIIVKIANVKGISTSVATAGDFAITFHGTAERPDHYKLARKYSAFRLPDGRTSRD